MLEPYYEDKFVRIYHGDCLEVLPQLPQGSSDMLFTDPPYNVKYEAEKAPSGRVAQRQKMVLGGIHNDAMKPAEYEEFLRNLSIGCAHALAPGAAAYVCGGTSTFEPYYRFLFGDVFKFSSVIVWDKGYMSLTRKDYHSQYEWIFYGWLPGPKKHKWFGQRQQTDIWQIERESASTYSHPTQKPVALCKRAILNSSEPFDPGDPKRLGDIILDPFMGSGSTLEAAKITGRRAIGIESDEHYCEVAARRMELAASKRVVFSNLKKAQYQDRGFRLLVADE